MPKWISDHLEPDEVVQASFVNDWADTFTSTLKGVAVGAVYLCLLIEYFSLTDPIWFWIMVAGGAVAIYIIPSHRHQTVITDRRILSGVRYPLLGSDVAIMRHQDVIWIQRSFELNGASILLTAKETSGKGKITLRSMSTGCLTDSRSFLDALQAAYPYDDVTTTDGTTNFHVRIALATTPYFIMLIMVLAFFESGAQLWSLVEASRHVSLGLSIGLFVAYLPALLLCTMLAGWTSGYLATAFWSRLLTFEEMCQYIAETNNLDCPEEALKPFKWLTRLRMRFAGWLYRRPIDLTPQSNSVSSELR